MNKALGAHKKYQSILKHLEIFQCGFIKTRVLGGMPARSLVSSSCTIKSDHIKFTVLRTSIMLDYASSPFLQH